VHRILNALGKSILTATREVPVLGRVPPANPFLSEENVEGGFLIIPAEHGAVGKLSHSELKATA